MSAPDRIWHAIDRNGKISGCPDAHVMPCADVQEAYTEYVRADLCDPTKDERVKALVDALRPFSAAVFNDNGDVTISTGHLKRQDWLKLRAALRDLEQGASDAAS